MVETIPKCRCRMTGSPPGQCGSSASSNSSPLPATASASRVTRATGSQCAIRYVKTAPARAGSSARERTSTNCRMRRAKRRASASPLGPKMRSSVMATVPGPTLADGCAAPSVKPTSLPRRARARPLSTMSSSVFVIIASSPSSSHEPAPGSKQQDGEVSKSIVRATRDRSSNPLPSSVERRGD
jgi:hypothetical protein